MTRNEVARICMLIQAMYPGQFAKYDDEQKSRMVDSWAIMLEEYDFNAIQVGLKVYESQNKTGFAPSPGQLIDAMNRVAHNDITEMSAEEAWVWVKKAICNGNYHAQEEYEKLPPMAQKAIGSWETIRDMAKCESSVNDTVNRSNFLKTYNRLQNGAREFASMPESIQKLTMRAAERLSGEDRQRIESCNGANQ